ncbi:serine hydrolase domain-containing protein [Streptomyces sp. NPDC048491]|uniref:serine hydrolase domain-containing protein n=1 Tax=Streptomyces sp. NPDC048491 TaxID=3157207 RepID=UPI00344179A3
MPYYVPSVPAAPRAARPLRQDLQNRLDSLAETHGVPGAQLVLDTGTETISVHTGIADAATGTPFAPDTAVALGSLTKPYTAALVLLLVDDGDLDLDEPVADHLPALRGLPEVTIRHLLSHTGGLPTGPDSDTASTTGGTRYLTSLCTSEQALFPPGTDFSYSNAGYVAAGLLVEEITGMPWHEAVRVLLLEPLGISAAFIGDSTLSRPWAAGHAVNTATGRIRPVQQNLASLEAPAGALMASAADLAALGGALIGRSDVLPPAVAKGMLRAERGARPGALADGWGLGVAQYRQGDDLWCGHDGNAQGTSCHLRIDPASGVVVAFTGNAGGATALWRELAADMGDLTDVRVPAGPAPAGDRGRPVLLPECWGTYRNGAADYRIGAGADGCPVLSIDGDLALPLVCYGDLSYDLVDPATGRREPGGRFHRDPATGRIERVQVSGRTARRTDDG